MMDERYVRDRARGAGTDLPHRRIDGLRRAAHQALPALPSVETTGIHGDI